MPILLLMMRLTFGDVRRAATQGTKLGLVMVLASAGTSVAAEQAAPKPADSASESVYHNGAMGFTYPYPKGWMVAGPDMLRSGAASMKEAMDSEAAAAAKDAAKKAKGSKGRGQDPSQDPGQPPPGQAPRLPELIFYAYAPGSDDGKSAASLRAVPSVRITSLESFGAMLTPEVLKSNAAAQEKKGMKVIRGPEKFPVGDQKLYRMDFEDARDGHTWVSVIQTVAYDHVLTIEILAGSAAQLDSLVSTVKDSVFADADKP